MVRPGGGESGPPESKCGTHLWAQNGGAGQSGQASSARWAWRAPTVLGSADSSLGPPCRPWVFFNLCSTERVPLKVQALGSHPQNQTQGMGWDARPNPISKYSQGILTQVSSKHILRTTYLLGLCLSLPHPCHSLAPSPCSHPPEVSLRRILLIPQGQMHAWALDPFREDSEGDVKTGHERSQLVTVTEGGCAKCPGAG